jgi:hypothetical protein
MSRALSGMLPVARIRAPASSFTGLHKSLTCLGALAILTAPGWEGTGQATPRGVAWLYAPPARIRDARMHTPREEEQP